MSQFQFSKDQMDGLLNMASKKMGISPDALKNQMQNNQTDQLLKNLPKDKQAQVSNLLNNPQAMEQFMQNPQIQTLLQRLMGK